MPPVSQTYQRPTLIQFMSRNKLQILVIKFNNNLAKQAKLSSIESYFYSKWKCLVKSVMESLKPFDSLTSLVERFMQTLLIDIYALDSRRKYL